jgi:hypothetical protein
MLFVSFCLSVCERIYAHTRVSDMWIFCGGRVCIVFQPENCSLKRVRMVADVVAEQIKTAFRKAALEMHPDRAPVWLRE